MKKVIGRVRGWFYAAIFKKKGVDIKKGLVALSRLDIRGPGQVIVGENLTVGSSPGEGSEFVTIYTHSPEAVVRIGNGVKLFGARISCAYSIQIGDDVLIEQAGIMDTDFHSIDRDRGKPRGESREKCRISLGARVAVAAKSTITKGVAIGDDAVVGPGSVVTRSLPAGCFAIGNPARPVGQTGDTSL